MDRAMGGLVAGVAAGGIFLLFFLVLGLGLPLSIGAGVAGFAGLMLVLAGKGNKDSGGTTPGSKALVQEAIQVCEARAREIDTLAKDIRKGTIRTRLDRIADLSRRIADDVRKDPKDAKDALRFMNYYGDTVCKIARLFRDLDSHGLESAAILETRTKVDRHLETLEKAFAVQLARLQEDNLLDLDTELKVLEQTIEMEGLGELIREEEARSGSISSSGSNAGKTHQVERPWDTQS